MVQGLTPVPYKIVTIASGLAGVPFFLFMAYSAITRSLRFIVLEGVLVHFFGAKAKELLEKYLEMAMVAVPGRAGRAGLSSPAFCATS